MSFGDLFKLAKLTIVGFKDTERSQRIGKYEVQYNPETLSLKHESVFQQQQGVGTTSSQGRWSHSRSKQLSVTLVLDGTNVDKLGVQLLVPQPTVADRIDEFLAICYQAVGSTHEPAYLRLTWGQGVLERGFDCRLQSAEIKYTAFKRDGSPLHAELVASFIESLDVKKKAKKDRFSSPDLTHRRVVVAGDTLPLLCLDIYGSAAHYLRVAQVNGLDDFRRLTPGQELIFPPFETSVAAPGEGKG